MLGVTRFWCSLILFGVFAIQHASPMPALAGADPSEKQAETPRARGPARSSRGRTVVLPPRLLVGQRVTLAVLDPAGRLIPGAAVEFKNGERVTTDATGRATFVAPVQPGALYARLVGRKGNFAAAVLPVASHPPDGVQVLDYPQVIAASDRFTVLGSGFRGEADANQVFLSDQPAFVLAASPVALVVLPGPRARVGPAELLIQVGGRSPGPVPLTLVSLELRSGLRSLKEGEKGVLTVWVRGSAQRLVIEARNLTPEKVQLSGGNVQRLTTTGGAANTADIELQSVRPGEFSVSVRLLEAARRRLQEH